MSSQAQKDAELAVRKIIGTAARRTRNRLGLTQGDVAERVGMAPEVYGRIERASMAPSIYSLRDMCLALNMSADELLGTGVSETPPEQLSAPSLEAIKESKYVRRIVRRAPGLAPSSLRLLAQLTLMLPTKDPSQKGTIPESELEEMERELERELGPEPDDF